MHRSHSEPPAVKNQNKIDEPKLPGIEKSQKAEFICSENGNANGSICSHNLVDETEFESGVETLIKKTIACGGGKRIGEECFWI